MERPQGPGRGPPGARGVEWSGGGGGEKRPPGAEMCLPPLKGTAVSVGVRPGKGRSEGSAGRSPSQSPAPGMSPGRHLVGAALAGDPLQCPKPPLVCAAGWPCPRPSAVPPGPPAPASLLASVLAQAGSE